MSVPSSRVRYGVPKRRYQTTLRRVTTPKTEEFIPTAAKACDGADTEVAGNATPYVHVADANASAYENVTFNKTVTEHRLARKT
jgi:hypothetical protein